MVKKQKQKNTYAYLPTPSVVAPRHYEPGEVVRLCRASDGRRSSYATVRAYDAARDVLELRFGTGECGEVAGRWRAVTRGAAGRRLPTDAWAGVASYLGAKRVLRFARVSRALHAAAGLDGGAPASREAWRLRVLARWRYGAEVVLDDGDWRACYERRLLAERALRKRTVCDKVLRNARNFAPRLCANPACCHVLSTRGAALAHHAVHPFSWTHLTDDDDRWLQATQQKLEHRRHTDDAAPALWRACKALRRVRRQRRGQGLGLA